MTNRFRGLFGDEPPGPARVLDCRRLGSPWSTVKVAATVGSLRRGEVLEVLSVDPTDLSDLATWCRRSGERLLSAHSLHGTYVICVGRRERRPPHTPRGSATGSASAGC